MVQIDSDSIIESDEEESEEQEANGWVGGNENNGNTAYNDVSILTQGTYSSHKKSTDKLLKSRSESVRTTKTSKNKKVINKKQ